MIIFWHYYLQESCQCPQFCREPPEKSGRRWAGYGVRSIAGVSAPEKLS